MTIGILYATIQEAHPYLVLSGAKEVPAQPFALYELNTPPVLITISGMGKVSAALAAQMLIREHNCDRILNAGVCGTLVDNVGLVPGNIRRVSSVLEGTARSRCPCGCHPLCRRIVAGFAGSSPGNG